MMPNNSYWPGSLVEGLTEGFGSRLSFYSGVQDLTRAFSKTDLPGKEIGRALAVGESAAGESDLRMANWLCLWERT